MECGPDMHTCFFRVFVVLLIFISIGKTVAQQNTNFLSSSEHMFWFDIQDLPTIKLYFSQDQWDNLLTSTRRDREEVSTNFIYVKNAIEYPLSSIGVKLSGNTSFTLPQTSNNPFVQANFTLDFDEFIDDQHLSGITAMKLKRFKDDSTFVHEPLSNQIMHNFDIFTAHSSTYVRLEIAVGNSDYGYFGIYRMNESVNRQEYIDKRFGENNDKGYLWQGNYKDWGIAHFSRITPEWGGVGDFDQASFEYKGKGSKFDEAKVQLIELAQNFTQLQGLEFEEYATQHINMPLFLKSMAAEAVLGHWDGFWGNGNNYMFYIDEEAVLHFIPFDTDNALGTSLFVEDVGERDPFNFGRQNTIPILLQKIMAIDSFRQEYKGYIRQLVTQDNLMVEDFSIEWIADGHNLIRDHLDNITGDNQQIIDRPANWGNQSSYRLFNLNTGKNWYATRKEAVLATFVPPVANAGADIRIETGETVQFDGTSSTDSDGTIESYVWSDNLQGSAPSQQFVQAGTFSFTLTVIDNDGLSDSDEILVTVTVPQPAPAPIPETSKNSGSLGLVWLVSLLLLLYLRSVPANLSSHLSVHSTLSGFVLKQELRD